MNNPRSSFWGNINNISVEKNPDFVAVTSATNQKFLVKVTDPALRHLKVTSGRKKFFVVMEIIDHIQGLHRVLCVYGNISDVQFVRKFQEWIDKDVELSPSVFCRLFPAKRPVYFFKNT